MQSRRSLLVFLAGLFGFFGFFAHGYVENLDGAVTLHAARAMYLRGDPGFLLDGPQTWEAERMLARGIAEPGPGVPTYGMKGENGRHYIWFPIGHQMLLVPCVALGEIFTSWFPEAEQQVTSKLYGEFVWARFFASFLPVLASAGSALIVYLLAQLLGCTARQSLLVMAVATLCTQFWPGSTETLSDPPGTFFLLAMALLAVRYHAGKLGRSGLIGAGICGGWAVLCRYPHAVPVMVLAAAIVLAAWRRRRMADVGWLALGALPEVAILLTANYLRFGTLTETGYSAGATSEWWNYPVYLGLPQILLAPGKGVLLFSPPLWIALALSVRRATTFPWLAALLIFFVPVVISGHTAGWAGGQCWSVRYVTASVVLLVTVALAATKPWQRRPRLFALVCGLGLLVSLGGQLTNYRGQQQLAYRASAHAFAEHAQQPDVPVNFVPRFSPLHTHWIYAWLSASGRLQRGGSENTTEPLFGIEVPGEVRVTHDSDVGFGHWWIIHMSRRHGWPMWPLLAVWLLGTGLTLGWSVRRIYRTEP